MLQALVPFAIENLSVGPSVHALTVSLPTFKMTKIGIVVGISLEAFTMTKVLLPCALILATIRVPHNSISASEACVFGLGGGYEPYINCLLVRLLDISHLAALKFCELLDRLHIDLS